MEQYPDGLFKTVAANLLKKKNGTKESSTLLKTANEIRLSPEQRRAEFLKSHNLKAEQFSGDPSAKRYADETIQKTQQQVRDFYQQQRASGTLPGVDYDSAEKDIMDKINARRKGAVEQVSINRTMDVANKNPEGFKKNQALSAQSENALGQSHGKEIGSVLGAAAGGTLGLLAGKRMPKKTTGLLQQVGGAAAGGAIGGISGGAIGSNRDEKRTGFNHEDVMKPYEIADRMKNQQKFR